jgi:hypothetical protein
MTTMKITIDIHDAWLARPEELRRVMALLAGLEDPPAGSGPADRTHGPCGERDEPSDPEGRARPRNGRYSGDDDRSQASGDDDEGNEDQEDPPTDGRQLLGWCAKQVPDAKGKVIGYGKKRGFPGRVVDWKPDQVDAAYRFARSRSDRARR